MEVVAKNKHTLCHRKEFQHKEGIWLLVTLMRDGLKTMENIIATKARCACCGLFFESVNKDLCVT